MEGLPCNKFRGYKGKIILVLLIKTMLLDSRGNTTSRQARVIRCYNCQGEGHMARQCTQPKRPRNAAWYKEKTMLAEAQEAGQILDEEQLAFLADPGILADQAQTIIPHNAASNRDLAQVPNSETYLNDMDNQSLYALQDFNKTSYGFYRK
ncbi:phosphopantothenoylcysteine decarboxylase-like protein [Tanacetum coccineum]